VSDAIEVVRLDGSRRLRLRNPQAELLAQIEDWEVALSLAHRLIERVPEIIEVLRDAARLMSDPARVDLSRAPLCAATIREMSANVAAGGIE
jgi:hypothetical protein